MFHEICSMNETSSIVTALCREISAFLEFPREDAGGLSREYVLRIPSVS